MKLLSRPEEIFLLAIWKLQSNAYALTIREQVKALTGEVWSFGAVFITLERLTKKGFLESFLSDSSKKRGGRSKRIYALTVEGKRALLEIKKLEESIWACMPELSIKSLG